MSKTEGVSLMKTRLESILRTLELGQGLILVSILASSGSTPRGAGAMMLVFEDGHTEGTIGGGAVEHAAELHARTLLKERTSDTKGYCLNKNDVADLGMICGGDVTVYFQYLYGQEMCPLFEHLLSLYEKNADSWLIRQLEDHQVTAMAVYDSDGLHGSDRLDAAFLKEHLQPHAVWMRGEPSYYIEPVTQAGRVYVFGGGHVSQELIPVLAHVGFAAVVYEDREAFAKKELFPQAADIILGDFRNISASVTFTENDYVIVMTRGHQADFEILAQVLKYPLSYIGCIGSRSKIAATRERLTALGYPGHIYDQVHSPIGLSIGAETPAEIAISIAGELIRHRAEKAHV